MSPFWDAHRDIVMKVQNLESLEDKHSMLEFLGLHYYGNPWEDVSGEAVKPLVKKIGNDLLEFQRSDEGDRVAFGKWLMSVQFTIGRSVKPGGWACGMEMLKTQQHFVPISLLYFLIRILDFRESDFAKELGFVSEVVGGPPIGTFRLRPGMEWSDPFTLDRVRWAVFGDAHKLARKIENFNMVNFTRESWKDLALSLRPRRLVDFLPIVPPLLP